MKNILPYLPFLIPIAVIQIALAVAALVHIFRHRNYRIGNRGLWVIVVVVFEILGPILYFTLGKGDD